MFFRHIPYIRDKYFYYGNDNAFEKQPAMNISVTSVQSDNIVKNIEKLN